MTEKKVERRRAEWNKLAKTGNRLKMLCMLEGCLIDPISEEEFVRNTNLRNMLVGSLHIKADMLPPLREMSQEEELVDPLA